MDSSRRGAPSVDCPDGLAQPLAVTLFMGDLNVVLAHDGFLASGSVGAGAGNLGCSGRFPRGEVSVGGGGSGQEADKFRFGVYIDDLCVLALAP